jgi:serine/threonine protein kinase
MPTNPFNPGDIETALGGRYVLGAEIRVGGQGVVYRAHRRLTLTNTITSDDVALKVHMHASQDLRVEREINAMTTMRHPNLANLIEAGMITVAGTTCRYASWEFIEGDALDHRLAGGALDAKTTCVIGRDVCRAIDHIWSEQRIVHRDVNPKNIMLRIGDRDAVLIDLGIARHLLETSITAPQMTWGTFGYLSPEQAQASRNLSCASDVFALGVTLQESLLGRHPTNRDQYTLLVSAPRTATLVPTAPAAMIRLIDLMMSARPAYRPPPRILAAEFAALIALL